jgi:hypothetical protein
MSYALMVLKVSWLTSQRWLSQRLNKTQGLNLPMSRSSLSLVGLLEVDCWKWTEACLAECSLTISSAPASTSLDPSLDLA